MKADKIIPTLNGTHLFKPEPRTLIDQLTFDLGVLAGKWRDTKQDRYIKRYHRTYQHLRQLGWEASLDIDQELPKEYMPQDYIERFKLSFSSSSSSSPE